MYLYLVLENNKLKLRNPKPLLVTKNFWWSTNKNSLSYLFVADDAFQLYTTWSLMVGKQSTYFLLLLSFQREGNGKRETRFNTFRVFSVRSNLNASNILTAVLASLVLITFFVKNHAITILLVDFLMKLMIGVMKLAKNLFFHCKQLSNITTLKVLRKFAIFLKTNFVDLEGYPDNGKF